MLRHFAMAGLLAAVSLSAGCNWLIEEDARRIVEPAAIPGRLALRMSGGSDHLIEKGRITRQGRVSAADGAAISYWVLRHRQVYAGATATDKSRGTVLLIHPLLTGKTWFLPLAQVLSDRGFDVVLPDLRGHGESGGKYVTWGAKEKDDLKRVMDRLLKDKAVSGRIYVMGASLGGCVAVQYAAYDKRCRGVVSICPPVGVREVAGRIHPLLGPHDLEVRLRWAGRMAGFNPDDASAALAARKLECPIVLIHGKLDVIVPYPHSEVIYEFAPEPRKLILVNWADHMTIQVGQDDWLADQLEALTAMGKG